MAVWLFKSEPDTYGYDDLVAEGKTWWTGVANATARKHLRTVAVGDSVWFYHTGKEKAIVGEMVVSQGPQPEADSPDGPGVIVEVQPVRKLAVPVSLATIKADPVFEGWDLVRIGRLSVVSVTPAMHARIAALGTVGG